MFNCVTGVPYPSVYTGWGGFTDTTEVPVSPVVHISTQIVTNVFALLGVSIIH